MTQNKEARKPLSEATVKQFSCNRQNKKGGEKSIILRLIEWQCQCVWSNTLSGVSKKEIYISRRMELRINSSKAIPEKSNKESVTQVGRAILEQGELRKYSDMNDIRERERERVREIVREREK